ncbi:hypothetical protein Slin15195_G105880 [Septoria linicola]|uniref:Uncharacterized protein n=1 Tax=Septoria linicola TaxID=215465 RepID=A0A9Q9EP45_9PEZI|nr:hypothetical protein Slin14017_G068890 [Septoria linicola]USW57269.1 hypothetical protein Slin15195_G105880 [Septoria linicola]
MFALTPLAIIGALVASVSAADSELLNLKSNSNSSFIQPSKIDDHTYKISAVGRPTSWSNVKITDEQNINNATVVAPNLGVDGSAPFLLDIYKVRAGGQPCAQVFFRNNMTYEEIGWDQQISIADAHFNYYTWDFGYVFYYCETPLVTDDEFETTTTLFMRRTEVPKPEGCWDTTFSVTREGIGR